MVGVEKRTNRRRAYGYKGRGKEYHCEIGDLLHGRAISDSSFRQLLHYCTVLQARLGHLLHGLTVLDVDGAKHLDSLLQSLLTPD